MFRTIFLCIVFFVLGAACASFYFTGYLAKNPEIEKVAVGFGIGIIILAIIILGIIKGYEDRLRKHKEEDLTKDSHKRKS